MHQHHHRHVARHAAPRRPDIIPRDRLPFLIPSSDPTLPSEPSLVRRAPESKSTCGDGNSSCEKPTSTTTTTTLPVILGAVVPILCAIAVLFYLHRRNVKRLRSEDANDKHRSLDFGLDMVGPASGGPMQQAEKGERGGGHIKGISLDIGHPYLMPPGLHGSGSRDSMHSSMSRSIEDENYRKASSYMMGDGASFKSNSRGQDDAASLAGSSRVALGDDMKQGLLGNAQRMSRSSPPLYTPEEDDRSVKSPVNHNSEQYTGLQLDLPRSLTPSFATAIGNEDHRNSAASRASSDMTDFKRDNDRLDEAHRDSLSPEPLGPSHNRQDSSQYHSSYPMGEPLPSIIEPHDEPQPVSSQPPRISLPLSDAASDYGDDRKSMIPEVNIHGVEDSQNHSEAPPIATIPIPEEPQESNRSLDPRRDTRRMTFGLRPLPPEDPADNPEQRANRIRSFYKEYFDDSKPTGRETYYEEDYGPEYYPEDYYDPYGGEYWDDVPAPFAEPVGRRAMTPPPRAPPRFQGHMANYSSSGLSGLSSPRAYSSASNRPPMMPRGAPLRPKPPPAPLNVLPSPAMLKDDAFMHAIDFAPGKNFRDQKDGRPETPTGGIRPFSPMTRAHTPLMSSFDDLSVMPSPHALRKSGTFTSLDFAPPPRFKTSETGSDTGSVRSLQTGISVTHLNNIRHGAYRVSRLPADAVGTKDDMMSSLRPKWDMR